ncbi:MAG: LacI family DNA-binding transcriptional regulator [Bacteroidota bacterium]
MDNKVPTIKEIAQRLNVSVSTVSRALIDHPRIGLRTKTLVRALAKELNYEPNSKAIFFKQKKSYVIGVILPYIREEFFSEAIRGIETLALDHDYTILLGQSFDDAEREKKVLEAFKKQRVDGVIISLSKQTSQYEHLQSLDKYDIPVVYFDRVPPSKNVHKVHCNLRKGTVELVNWLFNKGHRRIAFINGPDKIQASKERLDGYIDAIAGKKLKVDMQLVVRTDLTKERTRLAIQNLFALKNPPNAVISFNDYVHLDAVQYAQQQGIQINKEVLFVSYANLPVTGYVTHPPMASLEQYPYRQGEKAMELLMEILRGKSANVPVKTWFNEEIAATLIMPAS